MEFLEIEGADDSDLASVIDLETGKFGYHQRKALLGPQDCTIEIAPEPETHIPEKNMWVRVVRFIRKNKRVLAATCVVLGYMKLVKSMYFM